MTKAVADLQEALQAVVVDMIDLRALGYGGAKKRAIRIGSLIPIKCNGIYLYWKMDRTALDDGTLVDAMAQRCDGEPPYYVKLDLSDDGIVIDVELLAAA